MSRQKGIINIDALAGDVNMSVRNFERHFIECTSLPAKLYCCITRSNHALAVKLRNPHRRWTDIAYQTGYFNQMHLVKNFKRFCDEAPSVLLKEIPLLVESYTNIVLSDR